MILPPQTGAKKKPLKYIVKKKKKKAGKDQQKSKQLWQKIARRQQWNKVSSNTTGAGLLWDKLDSTSANPESPFSTKCPTKHIRFLTAGIRYQNLTGSYLCMSGRLCRKRSVLG